MVDALHAIDLGFAAHVVGNTLWEAIKAHKWGARNQLENVNGLHSELTKWFKDHGVSTRVQGKITKDRLVSKEKSGYPKFKA